mmetsp:Transcript_19988/g.58051  ORF Transcript_19988/g.58051 Transcript_19988/m.58051 type:complete len:241 (+) Transcript_19988:1895-2617(+)
MAHEVEDADPRVHVVGPPLLLQPAVQLEVLGVLPGSRGRRAALVLAELSGLVPVPPRHAAIADRNRLAGLGVLLGMLGRRGDERDAEHVRDALFLVAVPRLPRLVEHRWRRNGKTHVASEHEGGAGRRARSRMHRQPCEGDEVHQSGADIRPVEAQQPAGRRWPVHTETPGHDQLKVQHEEDDADSVVGVRLCDGEGGEVADVLSVHRRLSHRHGVAGREPAPAQTLVKHVVLTVVPECR